MYCINEQQIDYILNDISARGVEMESLQLNLLDHICCIIEQELEENGDFERFYRTIIPRFYKDKLSEIEEETHLLLTNKNYYVMKKVMISSGTFSAAALTIGIILKYMHAPGASIMIVLGIGIASLVFLPLLVTLKVKEKQKSKDKLLIVLGSISAIMMSLAILFKIQHWPGANVMGVLSPAILALVFLPIYFFGGIRNPETKVNTIVSSVLIIMGCGLFFSLTMTPAGMKIEGIRVTSSYLRNEDILKNEERQVAKLAKTDSINAVAVTASKNVLKTCEDLKAELLEYATGVKALSSDFESRNEIIGTANVQDFLSIRESGPGKLKAVNEAVFYFNSLHNIKPIPVTWTILDQSNNQYNNKVYMALNDVIQIQMLALQNQRALYESGGQKELVMQ